MAANKVIISCAITGSIQEARSILALKGGDPLGF